MKWGIAAIVVMGTFIIWLALEDAKRWEFERAKFRCVDTGETREHFSYMLHSGDVLIPIYATEHKWRCDDHERWRDE